MKAPPVFDYPFGIRVAIVQWLRFLVDNALELSNHSYLQSHREVVEPDQPSNQLEGILQCAISTTLQRTFPQLMVMLVAAALFLTGCASLADRGLAPS